MFELIEEASSIPLTLENAYYKQNKILKEMRFLYTAFDGVKLDISDNSKPPVILKGSICPFCYSIFEAKEDIILTDSFRESNATGGASADSVQSSIKYIILKLSANGKELIPEITESLIANYNEELGGFYSTTNNSVSKYINCIITYYETKYGISYFDIYNNEVY